MAHPPIPVLQKFSQHFVIECDASSSELRVVLMQHNRLIAFQSQTLKGKNLHLPTYETESLALATATKK